MTESSPTILVVDDDAGFISICTKILNESGCRVVTAATGSQAWRIVSEGTPDLILADLFVPQEGEFSFFKKIADYDPTIPVVGMTACAKIGCEAYARTVEKYGVISVFHKPFKWNTLLAVITQQLARTTVLPVHQYRIMVVDDNKAIHDSLSSVLCTLAHGEAHLNMFCCHNDTPACVYPRFDVVCFTEPLAAIQAVVNSCEGTGEPEWHAIFMDITLPGSINGIEAGRRIREINSHIPIIFCSAYTTIQWSDVEKELGPDVHNYALAKPFGSQDIKDILGRIFSIEL
jgi:CheY-like chemotaxis protein